MQPLSIPVCRLKRPPAAVRRQFGCQTERYPIRMGPMSGDGDPLDRLTKEALRDLLGKGWLTHDGMWFVQAAAALGIERANALNKAAIRSMSQIEVRRLLRTLGVDPAELVTSHDVRRFLADGLALLMPASVSRRMTVTAPHPSLLRLEWDDGECFAYKGMQRAGLLDGYECGVLYRVECWLGTLGIRHEVDPPVGLCRMRVDGRCATEFHLFASRTTPDHPGVSADPEV